jgi:hypothetical protein
MRQVAFAEHDLFGDLNIVGDLFDRELVKGCEFHWNFGFDQLILAALDGQSGRFPL